MIVSMPHLPVSDRYIDIVSSTATTSENEVNMLYVDVKEYANKASFDAKEKPIYENRFTISLTEEDVNKLLNYVQEKLKTVDRYTICYSIKYYFAN